jgi:hypothetical protein
VGINDISHLRESRGRCSRRWKTAALKDSAKKSPRLIKGAKEIYFPGAPHGLTATHQIKSTLTCWTFWENLRKSSTAA